MGKIKFHILFSALTLIGLSVLNSSLENNYHTEVEISEEKERFQICAPLSDNDLVDFLMEINHETILYSGLLESSLFETASAGNEHKIFSRELKCPYNRLGSKKNIDLTQSYIKFKTYSDSNIRVLISRFQV